MSGNDQKGSSRGSQKIRDSMAAFLLEERSPRFPFAVALLVVALAFVLRLLIAPVTAGLQ